MKKLTRGFSNPFSSKFVVSGDVEFRSMMESPSESSGSSSEGSKNELLDILRKHDDQYGSTARFRSESGSPKQRGSVEYIPKRIKDTQDGLNGKFATIFKSLQSTKQNVVFFEDNNEFLTTNFYDDLKNNKYFEDYIRVVFRKRRNDDNLVCDMTAQKKPIRSPGEPTIHHVLLSQMVNCGLIQTIVTTSVHANLFNCPRKNVVYVYGTEDTVECKKCNIWHVLENRVEIPKCKMCGALMTTTLVQDGQTVCGSTIQKVWEIMYTAESVLLLDSKFVEMPFTELPWMCGTKGKTIHIVGVNDLPKDIKKVFLEGGVGSLRNVHAYTFSEDFLLYTTNIMNKEKVL
jgi:NAD-dependent SIR2 family protein deacetylase